MGGDGATLLIPPILVERAKMALLATQKMSIRAFKLNLRIGIIPVSDIPSPIELKIAKLRISNNYDQAILRGGGVTYATGLLKDPRTMHKYQIVGDRAILAEDFSGLECRWEDIISRHGETLSLIIMATESSESKNDLVYREVIAQIQQFYGGDHAMQPVTPRGLHLTLAAQKLNHEVKVFKSNQSAWQKWLYLWQIRLNNLVGMFLMAIKHRDSTLDWSKFKDMVTESTDYQKFDDTLRMVIVGSSQQRSQLQDYLEQKYKSGSLVYGIHVSNRALMTCLVFERNGHQVHFVDGADGGYATAAKELKQRLKNLI